MLVLLIAINSINRSLSETTENNSLAHAFTKQQREVGMAVRWCGMLIRGQWDGPVTSEYCHEMGWNALIALHGQPLLLFLILRLFSLMGNISYYWAYSAYSAYTDYGDYTYYWAYSA